MNPIRCFLVLSITALSMALIAQTDGDHPITDGFGRTYLAPDALVGGGVTVPNSFNVGTIPNSGAALSVRGALQRDE